MTNPKELERRFSKIGPAEVRADDDGIKVAGYAAVFGEDADIGGHFIEVIERGAFTDALARGDDVVFLVNHEGLPLARSTSGTLTLKEDDKGLYMETVLAADDPDVQQIVPKMRRGDMTKMSFAFYAQREEWDDTGDIPRRRILSAALGDVSIVTTPAYEGTDIGLRSLDHFRNERQEQKRENFKATQRRLRLKMDLGLRSRRTAD
ncbi:MAG: HK97 family phage prohead protease [Kordiimonas sp.]|nr:HK97 family phage prohead protease [Kordiimonas sp.]